MKKVLKVLLGILEVVVIVYVIVMTAILMSKNKYGYTQFGKYTIATIDLIESRANEQLSEGDLLIVKSSSDYKEGDIIYYYAVYGDSYIIKSDVITRKASDDFSSIFTIGDKDSTTISESRVLGKDISVKHNLGSILKVLQSKLGFLFLVLLPILVIFIYQVYEFIILLQYEKKDKKEKKEK